MNSYVSSVVIITSSSSLNDLKVGFGFPPLYFITNFASWPSFTLTFSNLLVNFGVSNR